jgi:hypothetical protein
MNRFETRVRLAAVLVAALFVAGCSTPLRVKWPWQPAPAAAPEPANELIMSAVGGGAVPAWPQFWKRNTLLVDLQSAGAAGSFEMRPREGVAWPVRVAFRVRPGAFDALEVRGDQRVVLAVTREGSQPVEIELAPGVYGPRTRSIAVSWGAAQSPPGAR